MTTVEANASRPEFDHDDGGVRLRTGKTKSNFDFLTKMWYNIYREMGEEVLKLFLSPSPPSLVLDYNRQVLFDK
jgi:hypothetical protein